MSTPLRAKVLVVDDSAFARKVLREVLSRSPGLELVGFARDGLEALERITELKPDVVCMDLVMPELDGLGLLDALKGLPNPPRVVVVSSAEADSERAVEALAKGAFDVVTKPTSLATDRLYELSAPLTRTVLAAAAGRVVLLPPAPAPLPELPRLDTRRTLLAIGTSTGGPQALATLLPMLPSTFPLPVVIALHIPAEYTRALAQRLANASQLPVAEAEDGMRLEPGKVALARGGHHLFVERDRDGLYARVTREPLGSLYHPSVNLLFESAARACGAGVLAAVLTGMGDDGLDGARVIAREGGQVITEAESSCVVYGMPRAVRDGGFSAKEAPLELIAAELLLRL
ncbi:MAG: chemotaxis-specific protein-glutamate methyltransferase CheB [Archangiaceae bacterium]|nr:chemotaxis-specific protein-glutamate methyltransferase CheB [Archangiaceae bacterium]